MFYQLLSPDTPTKLVILLKNADHQYISLTVTLMQLGILPFDSNLSLGIFSVLLSLIMALKTLPYNVNRANVQCLWPIFS